MAKQPHEEDTHTHTHIDTFMSRVCWYCVFAAFNYGRCDGYYFANEQTTPKCQISNTAKLSRIITCLVMMPRAIRHVALWCVSVTLCTPPLVSHHSVIVATTAAVYPPALFIDSICLYLLTCVCVCACVRVWPLTVPLFLPLFPHSMWLPSRGCCWQNL